jgi:hypothetical protein
MVDDNDNDIEGFDPDDFEAMDEMHMQAREFMAASEFDLEQARGFIANLLAFNRYTADSILTLGMIVGRVKLDHDVIAESLNDIGNAVKSVTLPGITGEEDDDA